MRRKEAKKELEGIKSELNSLLALGAQTDKGSFFKSIGTLKEQVTPILDCQLFVAPKHRASILSGFDDVLSNECKGGNQVYWNRVKPALQSLIAAILGLLSTSKPSRMERVGDFWHDNWGTIIMIGVGVITILVMLIQLL